MKNQIRFVRGRGKRLMRRGLAALPKPLRHKCYRSLVRLSPQTRPELAFKIAETREELEAAFQILHDAYVGMGFMTAEATGMRVTLHHALPSTTTLIARWNNEIVGTVSVIRENPLGLPLEKIFDLDPVRADGARLAEISALAVKKSYRGNAGEVLFPLLKYMYAYAQKYLGVERLVIATHPNRTDFYEGLFFFDRLAPRPIANYDFVNGAPADGLVLDLEKSFRKCAAYYGERKPVRDLFNYFQTPCAAFAFPERPYFTTSDPRMTPELLDYFFNECTSLFEGMTDEEHRILTTLYDHGRYASVFPPRGAAVEFSRRRGAKRFDVDCRARFSIDGEERFVGARVREVSARGLSALLDDSLRFGSSLAIRVMVGDFAVARLEGEVIWEEGGACGVRLSKACRNWRSFIAYLESDLA